MRKHLHSELILQYAHDAMETEAPWARWEVRCKESDKWLPMNRFSVFDAELQYRRKPRTIRIGEYDVPEPVREPLQMEQFYFHVELFTDNAIHGHYWKGSVYDYRLLERGLVHIDPKAAEIHAKALISLTSKGGAE